MPFRSLFTAMQVETMDEFLCAAAQAA